MISYVSLYLSCVLVVVMDFCRLSEHCDVLGYREGTVAV